MPTPVIAGDLKWVGGSNDRLRTSNNAITRYDINIGSVGTSGCTGRIYVNASSDVTRYLELNLNADDEVTLIACGDSAGVLNFEFVTGPQTQKDQSVTTTTAAQYKYVAKYAGKYRIYDSSSKPSYYRVLRKPATYATITGSIDESLAAGIPAGYSVSFTNAAGKVFASSVVNSGSYSVNLPVGYTYQVGLIGTNSYIVSNGVSLNVSAATTNHDLSVIKVDLKTVTGNITGLATTDLLKLGLVYTPSTGKIYVPKPIINTTTGAYTVDLETNTQYVVSGTGVNDFEILSNTINISEATNANIVFSAKPLYDATLNVTGLDAIQLSNLKFTFTNKDESGYKYSFNSASGIKLRTGTYFISYTGLDNYPVDLGLVFNLIVNNAAVAKTLEFKPVSSWSFDDRTITTSTTAYKGMLFGGTASTISNQLPQGHLLAKSGSTIQIPVNVGDNITFSYYYTANFSINGGASITTATNSITNVEKVEYSYPGTTPGYVTITMGGAAGYTTYITDITIGKAIAYSPIITVGADKTYKTINAALDAVAKMKRIATDRVTIMVDPGNYEEMLVITQPNVTLNNSASNPSIALLNKGVDIDANAVRVTSYYGHGYNYYSMSSDQKWHEDVLKVNKENGYYSYVNTGSGTTSGSFWNATVVINAAGFEANNIIFENSYNQYISKKESEDIVVEWASGGKGKRPTNVGNTAVQNKSFVERAAAIAVLDNVQKVVLNNCRVIGRQDSFYGGKGARVVVYKGVLMGGTDFLFGGMTAVFYKTALAMNTSEDNNDVSYITAAQQDSGRGYLMYECIVTSATPGTETASQYRSKPGYFGRPWSPNTSEVVFYNTTIETSNNPNFTGQSLIVPVGWNNSLGGTSASMYEYGTIENSGVNNQASRATWATKLSTPFLLDGTTEIITKNFTKGTDGWDPIPLIIKNDPSLGIKKYQPLSTVNVFGLKNKIAVSNVKSASKIFVYGLNGALVKSFETNSDTTFDIKAGTWIVLVTAEDGQKSVKLMTY